MRSKLIKFLGMRAVVVLIKTRGLTVLGIEIVLPVMERSLREYTLHVKRTDAKFLLFDLIVADVT